MWTKAASDLSSHVQPKYVMIFKHIDLKQISYIILFVTSLIPVLGYVRCSWPKVQMEKNIISYTRKKATWIVTTEQTWMACEWRAELSSHQSNCLVTSTGYSNRCFPLKNIKILQLVLSYIMFDSMNSRRRLCSDMSHLHLNCAHCVFLWNMLLLCNFLLFPPTHRYFTFIRFPDRYISHLRIPSCRMHDLNIKRKLLTLFL